jgi:hypothetical protein
MGVEQGDELAGGVGVIEFIGGAGGQRPGPPQIVVSDPEDADVIERGAGMA